MSRFFKTFLSLGIVICMLLSICACDIDTDVLDMDADIGSKVTTDTEQETDDDNNKDNKPSDGQTGGGNGGTGNSEPSISDKLGFDKQDNSGKKFVILANNSYAITERDFYVDDIGYNQLSKAIYERNKACEEYLNVSLELERRAGAYNSDMVQHIRLSIMSGECPYDMVAMGLNTGITGGYIDIYENVMKMDGIDLNHQWWTEDIVKNAAINNQLYFLTGDACLSMYNYMGCILANLDVADDWRINTDLYKTVKSGDWTIDEMLRLTKLVGEDTDGNGTMESIADETYGWCMHNVLVRLMWSSCNIELIVRQADGTFALRDSMDARMTDFVDKLRVAYNDPHTDYVAQDSEAIKDFVYDRVLLMSTYLGTVENLRVNNIESSFAILPMPKYDGNQKDYISASIGSYNALFFPITMSSPELSAQVAEFMGYYGNEKVVPTYYDEMFKYKLNNNVANVEMLDLIRDKLCMTTNETYGLISAGGVNPVGSWVQLTDYSAKNGFYASPASFWQINAPTAKNAIQSYVFQYFQ